MYQGNRYRKPTGAKKKERKKKMFKRKKNAEMLKKSMAGVLA